MSAMTFQQTFTGEAAFEAISAACAWLRERGYSVGEMQGPSPMGILKGDWSIAKWRNLTPKERSMLDGRIEGDKRMGPVVVHLREAPERP